MKKYIVPEYANEVLESKDLITVSVGNGVIQTTDTRVDPETNETYEVTVYSLSSKNLF